MGLFDKKECDVCGGKIGLLGNRKLQDGNLCKDCAKKLSPWFDERRHSTVEQIKQQLAYREENQRQLANFHPNRTIGQTPTVYVDDAARKFAVCTGDWRSNNADLIDISQVTSCNIDVVEHREELYWRDEEGKRQSYFPPRYEVKYEFKVRILINSPWFDDISYEMTELRPTSTFCDLYRRYEQEANELRNTLQPQPQYGQPQPQYGQQPGSWTCSCGAVNQGKFCSNCGQPQPSTKPRIRCDKCGWEPEDPTQTPKFCPQCGDPIDHNDQI